MGKSAMVPVEEVDLSNVQYRQEKIDAPHLTGNFLKLCVWIVESRLLGRSVLSFLKSKNKVTQILQHTRIPEAPMFFPEFPPQDPENAVNCVDEYTLPTLRVASALECLPAYNSSAHWGSDSRKSFLYWTIRDYAHAYRCGWTTPSDVAEYIISAVEKSLNDKPAMMFFISFNADEVRKQAAASTTRFQEGKPLSILDGIFIPIKDDIDCYPYPTRGGTVWFHKMREVKKDAVSVSRLRSCGVILVGKANMHELGMGVTGNNPHHGTVRNPHSTECYPGGSSSGPAAIVASGLCPASVGTDGGGSVRIPAALCGVVGLKTTYGRTDMKGALCEGGTVESVTPLAATVEDAMLVYAAMSGSSPTDLTRLRPMPPCYPKLGTTDNLNVLGSIKLGKYANWFDDVYSDEISETCERMLSLLTRSFGIETREIVLPELEEMRVAHVVSIGSEALSHVYSSFNQGRRMEMSYDVRVNMALFESFSAANYVSAQSLRRRIMHYHMEAFKLVDIIVTPTTGMTAPKIPPSSLKIGETDLQTSGYLMRFVIAPNLIGLPAISVPVGYDKDGLPIGLQLIGQPWAEATLLRLASAIEELAPSQKRPAVFYDVLEGKSKF
jgi:Asp-tRNA(Asn)/Glu-tRNA(Gln) amidotransferase A subunit family amidase